MNVVLLMVVVAVVLVAADANGRGGVAKGGRR